MTVWCQNLLATIQTLGPGSYVVEFPTYRPDLVEELASRLGCAHIDFRREYLAPLKFEAHKLPLAALEGCAQNNANAQGVVLQNGEALLAAKPASDRVAWLQAFLDTPRAHVALLPLALFGGELASHPRLIRFAAEALPPENFLGLLSSMRVV